MQYTIDQIRMQLADRNLAAVSKATGISRQTLSAIRCGRHTGLRLATWVKIVSYLERTTTGENA